MIQKAVMNEEYFVVLLPQGAVLKKAREIQKILAEKYQVYAEDSYPGIHITLDRIKRASLQDAGKVIENFISQAGPVDIILNEFTCYQQEGNNSFLVLKILETASLIIFSKQLHQRLSDRGFSTLSNYQEWEFHITLISNTFAQNPIPELEFDKLCLLLEGGKTPCTSQADRLEIWQAIPEPGQRCLKSFKL